MSTALIEREKTDVMVDNELLKKYLKTFSLSNNMDENEQELFLQVAMAYQLNPFKREIYCIPYGDGEKRRLSIITGYEVYLKRAERSKVLKGWKSWTEGEVKFETKQKTINYKDKKTGETRTFAKEYRAATGNLKAVVEIWREGWKEPFIHEVYLDEYYQDNEMWGAKPRTMLKKVAIAQGFRMAFPDEMGGMPYTEDEIPSSPDSVHGTGTADDPEVIPPPAPSPAVERSAQADEPRKTAPGAPVILIEGKEIPKAYWNLNSEQKSRVMPDGCKSEKVNGVWLCIRA